DLAGKVDEADMDSIERVLDHLEPVAGPDLDASEQNEIWLFERLLAWQIEFRRRVTPNIGKNEIAVFVHRIGCNPDARRRCGSFGGSLGALAAAGKLPTVIHAADLIALHPAGMEKRAPMGATPRDQVGAAAVPAIEGE